MLQPGQLITGRKVIAEKFGVTESKVQRILKDFESEQQIEQQTSNKNRLVTILSWSDYQNVEQQDERQMNDKRTTDEHKQEVKKERSKEIKNKDLKDIKESGQAKASPSPSKRFIPPTLEEVKAYCEERQNGIDADKWIDYYISNGWMVGRNKMKDWKATVRYWERNTISNYQKQNTAKPSKPYIPTVSKNDAPASTMTEEEKQALLQKYAEAEKKQAEAETAVTKIDDSDWR